MGAKPRVPRITFCVFVTINTRTTKKQPEPTLKLISMGAKARVQLVLRTKRGDVGRGSAGCIDADVHQAPRLQPIGEA